MKKTNIKDKIRANCFEIAMLLMWESDKIPLEKAEAQLSEIAELTDKLIEIACDEFEKFESLGCKVESLQRAIDYLKVHAIPPLKSDFSWFKYSLTTLLELAFPNYSIEDSDLDFVEKELKPRFNS